MPTFHIHHRLILCLLGLWKQDTVFLRADERENQNQSGDILVLWEETVTCARTRYHATTAHNTRIPAERWTLTTKGEGLESYSVEAPRTW